MRRQQAPTEERRNAGLAIALSALFLLTACGGSSKADPQAERAAAQAARSAAEQRYAACMKAAGWDGVSAPASPSQEPRFDDPKFRDDDQRCQTSSGLTDLLEREHNRTVDNAGQQNRQVRAFVDCMRKKGWKYADPTVGVGGVLSLPAPPPGAETESNQSAFGGDLSSCNATAGGSFIENAPGGVRPGSDHPGGGATRP